MHQFLLVTYSIRSYKLFMAGLTHWVLNVPYGEHGTFVIYKQRNNAPFIQGKTQYNIKTLHANSSAL